MNSLLNSSLPKAWANLYINKLTTANGIKMGNNENSVEILNHEQYVGDIIVNNGGPINQPDAELRTLKYNADVTYTAKTKTVKLYIKARTIQGADNTNAITTGAIPEVLRPSTYSACNMIITDNDNALSSNNIGNAYLGNDGIIKMRVLQVEDLSATANAFTGGNAVAAFGPKQDIIFEFTEFL